MLASAGQLAKSAVRSGKFLVVAAKIPGVSANDLRTLAGDVKGRLGSEPAVVALFGDVDGKVPFLVVVNAAGQDAGARAGDLVKSFAGKIGGRGGGKADTAQGAGSDASGIDSAIIDVISALAGL